jgi:hypothetical protein
MAFTALDVRRDYPGSAFTSSSIPTTIINI